MDLEATNSRSLRRRDPAGASNLLFCQYHLFQGVGQLLPRTINSIALSQIAVVLCRQQAVSIASDDAFNVAAMTTISSRLPWIQREDVPPIIHVEEKALHTATELE